MNNDIQNRYGESITREDESQILDTISKWLDRDVRDKVLDLEHADEYPGMGLPGSTYAKFEECETFSHSNEFNACLSLKRHWHKRIHSVAWTNSV